MKLKTVIMEDDWKQQDKERVCVPLDADVIPPCKGYKSWTDCGYEYYCGYDDEAKNDDYDVPCDECICVTANHNDFTGLDPRTGKKFKAV